MKRLTIVTILLLLFSVGMLVACTAGLTGIFSIASVEESTATPTPLPPM